jgi:hypothetical protein
MPRNPGMELSLLIFGSWNLREWREWMGHLSGKFSHHRYHLWDSLFKLQCFIWSVGIRRILPKKSYPLFFLVSYSPSRTTFPRMSCCEWKNHCGVQQAWRVFLSHGNHAMPMLPQLWRFILVYPDHATRTSIRIIVTRTQISSVLSVESPYVYIHIYIYYIYISSSI